MTVNSLDIRTITATIIRELYGNGKPNAAVLASIRNAASFASPQAQKVWPIMFNHLTPEMLSTTGEPTYAETAIYAALRFYAVSQQGNYDHLTYATSWAPKGEEAPGETLFHTLALMRAKEKDRKRLNRRVRILLESTNADRVINEMSHLVSMVKASNLKSPIDYAQLASDLYNFQFGYEAANRVRIRWGQQYFRQFNSDKLKGSQTND
ncbi:type I-E CRISPR-associated protein Cse2/CasB [Levilactobacillus bambusae]|uniref:Type I-E CRISPR-associated protein Cse2/CasB n=1 Tax=Levilactobacillus bambusae TaxID=2024736 RepID=A0A2V1MZT7_9LACO|nr:type I-E CRISPR-associated protein Cse2/CasB [Levilactobacillus bambusae]PWG00484.1 type I-E CRISPR-associated protein Cse2/CasB [Levilactobacillus bambusae]